MGLDPGVLHVAVVVPSDSAHQTGDGHGMRPVTWNGLTLDQEKDCSCTADLLSKAERNPYQVIAVQERMCVIIGIFTTFFVTVFVFIFNYFTRVLVLSPHNRVVTVQETSALNWFTYMIITSVSPSIRIVRQTDPHWHNFDFGIFLRPTPFPTLQ